MGLRRLAFIVCFAPVNKGTAVCIYRVRSVLENESSKPCVKLGVELRPKYSLKHESSSFSVELDDILVFLRLCGAQSGFTLFALRSSLTEFVERPVREIGSV